MNTAPQFAGSWGKPTTQTPAKPAEATQPPPPTKSVRCKLKSVSDVSVELAKLYRECRSGKLDAGDLSKLANVLYILSRTLESSELEQRIAALEEREY